MASSSSQQQPPAIPNPFPIFRLANRHLLYDVDTVSYVRREHNISGVFIGGLPQASQQNVFLGLPLQLMPEEVRLLVEAGAAYVVDDVRAHKRDFLGEGGAGGGLSGEERKAFQAALRKQGISAAREAGKRSDDRKKAALQQRKGAGTENWNDIPEDMLMPAPGASRKKGERKTGRAKLRPGAGERGKEEDGEDETLFASPMKSFPLHPETPPASTVTSTPDPEPCAVTPTTSLPPIHVSPEDAVAVTEATKSYPLFKHLHQKGYFLSPGLRFGCQYMAYPGDPLRFHSHFLCRGMDWDEEFDILDLVGGGRLGTGVKKGYLIGGEDKSVRPKNERDGVNGHSGVEGEDRDTVRAFCVEWGGM